MVMLMAGLIPGKRAIYVVLIWNPHCLEERAGSRGHVEGSGASIIDSVFWGSD